MSSDYEWCSHLKKEIDLYQLLRQDNYADHFNKKFSGNHFHASEVDYLDYYVVQICY